MKEEKTLLTDEFLHRIATDLDDDTVQSIILHGSYARGDAVAPYSDIDLVRILDEACNQQEDKHFVYRDGYLLSISSRPLSVYYSRFAYPETAIFAISGVREARILLDKNESFKKLQQEAWSWTWEPLQAAAHTYASKLLVAQTEIVLKAMRALTLGDSVALADMTLDLFSALTEAVAVGLGVLMRSGNTYFHQVQEAVGQQSSWTRSHLRIATETLSAEERGKETLLLYRETCRLLRPAIAPEHWVTIAQCLELVEQYLAHKEIS